jgi:putative endonuclease
MTSLGQWTPMYTRETATNAASGHQPSLAFGELRLVNREGSICEGCPPQRVARRRALQAFCNTNGLLNLRILRHSRGCKAYRRLNPRIGRGQGDCFLHSMREKYLVYIIRTVNPPMRYYTGLTSDMDARLDKHNAGGCPSTASGRPWEVVVVIEFRTEQRAAQFERYLKSGSGCAFATRHFR